MSLTALAQQKCVVFRSISNGGRFCSLCVVFSLRIIIPHYHPYISGTLGFMRHARVAALFGAFFLLPRPNSVRTSETRAWANDPSALMHHIFAGLAETLGHSAHATRPCRCLAVDSPAVAALFGALYARCTPKHSYLGCEHSRLHTTHPFWALREPSAHATRLCRNRAVGSPAPLPWRGSQRARPWVDPG